MTTLAFVLLVVALAAGAIWIALLYGGRTRPEPGLRGVAAGVAGAVAGLAAAGMIAAIAVANADSTTVAGRHGDVELTASEQRGSELFSRTCAACHALAAANAVGDVGPDLDLIRPPVERTLRTIATGSIGYTALMPPNLLRGREAQDVAAYVAKVAGR